ncbi:hypothetical protein SAMN04244579_00805 [Azotobacter beijerinckii]|uniref:Uncharacterized protein n=1 Tax=Azotobacter beijerinckii TaxID=170623 RepID=A0A1H6R3E7_9GAMM|nr:hypothetical protein [Azotobacter beijerinckii]SEI48956.1 hypothetical protein SAMN04244579_00805 [Azotobacter beijerinckii]
MKQRQEMVAQYRASFGELCARPEHRHIEPYTSPRRLNFAPPETDATRRIPGRLVLALTSAYALLADWQECRDPSLAELGSWQRYLALPRRSATEKLIAEVFRILRVFRAAAIQHNGAIEIRDDGLVRASCTYNRCALNLLITQSGLELLAACVAGYLESFDQPYSEAYQELLFGQYYADIVAEIRAFADDDRVLFQFRHKGWFNRHLRLDCDTPRLRLEEDGHYCIDLGKYGENAARHPIDFYISLDSRLYIVPVEALKAGRLAAAELARWQARTDAEARLPDAFRLRFAHEKNVVGLPMT